LALAQSEYQLLTSPYLFKDKIQHINILIFTYLQAGIHNDAEILKNYQCIIMTALLLPIKITTKKNISKIRKIYKHIKN